MRPLLAADHPDLGVIADHVPDIVLIEGEAGIGKSRLVQSLTDEAHAAGAVTLGLRQFTTRCRARSLDLSAARRAGIESFPATWLRQLTH